MPFIRLLAVFFLALTFSHSASSDTPRLERPSDQEIQENPLVWTRSKSASATPAPLDTHPHTYIVTPQRPLVSIRLPYQAGTGYSWYAGDLQGTCLRFKSYHTENQAQSGVVGGPGFAVWDLEAQATCFSHPQKIVLSFYYQQSWNEPDPKRGPTAPHLVTIFTQP